MGIATACNPDDELSLADQRQAFLGTYTGLCITPIYPDYHPIDTTPVMLTVELGPDDSTVVLRFDSSANETVFVYTGSSFRNRTPGIYSRSLSFSGDTLRTQRRPSLGSYVSVCEAVRE